MNNKLILSAAFAAAIICGSRSAASAQAHAADQDTVTLLGQEIDEVQITARVEQPTDNHTTLDKTKLNQTNIGQNLPYLLNASPSVVVMSDDGLGIGYTYFRVRGTDQARINMTINDVPLNDGESQNVFWVNMSDLASSMTSLNIQRGVGTSTNGSSAFGASVNMSTLNKNVQPNQFEVSFNGGMYKTFRETASARVALKNNWQAEARFSKVNSDGYLERAFSDLYSYSGKVGYYGKKTTAVLSVFGGSEKTYMAWDGVSWEDMHQNPRYNPAGKYTDDNGKTAYYPNQTDNYAQQHAQFSLMQALPKQLSLNVTLHYTHGGGYYEQYREDKKFSSVGLSPYTGANGEEVKRSDFIRQKHLNNHYFGAVTSLRLTTEPVDAQFGVAANDYLGSHWGNLTYVRDSLYPYNVPYNYEFYRSTGDKIDANVYAKANWRIIHRARQQLVLYADLQYRFVRYSINGINDEDLKLLDIHEDFHFFNPKAGLTWQYRGHNTYFNFAIANREPNRKNYTEAGMYDIPKSERLYDYELGYSYTHTNFQVGLNLYFMDYKNQLVLTGKYSSTGAYLTRNVPNSYRMGAELSGSYSPVRWFSWAPALTISRNRIPDYSDWISIYDEDWNELRQEEVRFGEVTIAMSPSFIFNNTFTFNIAGFRADILTSVVSRQYLDNTMSAEAVLPTYTVTNLNLEYKLPLPDKCPHMALRCQVNNVFNTLYAANGGNWMCQFTDGSRYYSPWYYPQAGINAHAGFTLRW